ncbi:MAG: squalene/phytoene synthase family protein [Patescibacteria group bacterium]
MEDLARRLLDPCLQWLKSRPEVRESLIISGQKYQLYSRSPGKYEAITTALFLLSTFNPLYRLSHEPKGIAPAIEVAYHFCRMIDDFADGDAPIPVEFKDFSALITSLKAQLRHDQATSANTDPEFLLKRLLYKMDCREDLDTFLDAMKVEHDKRTSGEVFTREALEKLYNDSFGAPHRVAFAALGSTASGESIQDLFQLQGRLYAVRDLIPELSKGIIFIPKEVMDESGLNKETLVQYPEESIKNPAIQKWIAEEYEYGLKVCGSLMESAKTMNWIARGVISFLVNPIETRIKVQLATA